MKGLEPSTFCMANGTRILQLIGPRPHDKRPWASRFGF